MPTIDRDFDPNNTRHLNALKHGPHESTWKDFVVELGLHVLGVASYEIYHAEAARILADHCLAQIEQNADDLTAAYNVGRADEREGARARQKDADLLWEIMSAHGCVTSGRDITDEYYGTLQIDSTDFDRAVGEYNDAHASKAKPWPDGDSVTKFRAVVFEAPYGGTAIYGDDTSEADDDFDDMLTYLSDKVMEHPIEPRAILNIRVPLPQVPTVEVEAEVEAGDV